MGRTMLRLCPTTSCVVTPTPIPIFPQSRSGLCCIRHFFFVYVFCSEAPRGLSVPGISFVLQYTWNQVTRFVLVCRSPSNSIFLFRLVCPLPFRLDFFFVYFLLSTLRVLFNDTGRWAWPPGSCAKEGRLGGRETTPRRAGATGHEEARKSKKREERNAGIERSK